MNIIDWLQTQHDKIMACEDSALESMQIGDIDDYRKKMREKAELLAGLTDLAAPMLAQMPKDAASKLHAKLSQISESAATALDLDSVFYMSALLYPDEHKKGEPDNLQKLINAFPMAWSTK